MSRGRSEMTGNGSLTEPAGGSGRAVRSGALALILDQEFGPDTLYALRAAVQAHAVRAGLTEDRAGDLVLAAHELAANAIAHGAGCGQLRLWSVAGALSCEVLDGALAAAGGPLRPGKSRGGPSEAGEPRGGPSEAGEPRGGPGGPADPWPVVEGHGLWLARRVAVRLDVWSGRRGTRAVATFRLPATR